MHWFRYILVALYVIMACTVYAQSKPHRILIVLNGSFTMANSWNTGTTYFQAASMFVNRLTDSMYARNNEIEFGLRLYGAQYPLSVSNCFDTRKEVAFSYDNRSQIDLRLADIVPRGKGSLGYAINKAQTNELKDTGRYQYSVIIISNKDSSCTSDVCSTLSKTLYKRFYVCFDNIVTSGCYDAVYPLQHYGDINKIISSILVHYPAKTIATDNWQTNSRKQTTPSSHVSSKDTIQAEGFANIINTDRLHTVTVYVEENGTYKEIEEVFFYGADARKIKLKPGNYKAAYRVGGIEVARLFKVVKGMITNVKMQ